MLDSPKEKAFNRTAPGRAREGVNPLAPRHPRGVGEQSAPRSCRRKQSHQKNSLLRGKRTSPPEQSPGERERVATLSPRLPRGCRGAERPTPVSPETKAIKRTACFVGNQNLRQNSPGELERAAALSNFNQKDFPQENHIRFPRGWQWRGSLLPRPHYPFMPTTSRPCSGRS